MLFSIPYGTFANYSPRGTSELSEKSKRLCGRIKAADHNTIMSSFPLIKSSGVLNPLLNKETILVPIPRSALNGEGVLWPAKEICQLLVKAELGKEVVELINRTMAVEKSSSKSSADERTSIKAHLESLTVNPQLLSCSKITLVDDVLTLGRTSFACAMKIHDALPQLDIGMFAIIRTQGFVLNIEKIVDPAIGTINYNPTSGKTSRNP